MKQTLDYVRETNPFGSAKDAANAEYIIAAFNQKHDTAVAEGKIPPHPRLDEKTVRVYILWHLLKCENLR